MFINNLQRPFLVLIIIQLLFLQQIIPNEFSMILKNNRFFGRDISNIVPSIMRNQSQEMAQKQKRRQSLSLVEQMKPPMKNIQKLASSTQIESHQLPCLPEPIQSNSQHVPQYFYQIFNYINRKEKCVIGNYCQKTINIDKVSRGEIVNWLIEVHHKFKLFPSTLYLVIYFLDKYLASKNIQKSKLKLIAVSTLYMASKYEQTYRVPQMKDLLNLCSYAFTKRDILETQADIIKVLNFDLVMDTSFRFLEALEVYSQMNKKNFHLAQYLLELSLTQSEFLEYSQNLLAASAFYLVCKIRKVEINWDGNYQQLTGFKQSDLHKCARQLCNLLERIDKINHVSALKKKFSEAEFHEVTRLKLQRKK